MPILGVTGGIATGKSTFVQTFLRFRTATVFDADRCAHELLERDETIIERTRMAFGGTVFDPAGQVNRALLREFVFAEESRRRKLETILHPAIRERWLRLAEECRESRNWVLVDLPLLFETSAESAFDRTIVVASSLPTQQRRLREHKGLDESMIEKIIGAQLPIAAKVKKADHVVWNDSSASCLAGQVQILVRCLTEYYG